MMFSICINYSCGRLIDSFRQTHAAKLIVTAGIMINLLLLGRFKYTNFIIDSINQLFAVFELPHIEIGTIHLPIGISFFTFQAISYIVDVYRKEARVQKNLLDCGLFIALFPQLIAGPIVRYHDIAEQLQHRSHSLEKLYSGMILFTIGLGKKMLIANPMGEVTDQIFAIPGGELGMILAWTGAFSYMLQIYFDFSGYSDMAIGLGRLFGFQFLINFNYPYIARSFREFWRRWHISLSNWFRDYLYIPLGGNQGTAKRVMLNLLIVFFLCGLWHGASWNFIVWGLLHGFFLVLERGKFGVFLKRWPRFFQHLYLMVGLLLTWVIFRAESLDAGMQYLNSMAGFTSAEAWLHPVALYWDRHKTLVACIAILAATPLFSSYTTSVSETFQKYNHGSALYLVMQFSAILIILILCAMELAAGTHNPFIYFRF